LAAGQALDRHLDIGVGKDDERRVAAHSSDDFLSGRRIAASGLARRRRAAERDFGTVRSDGEFASSVKDFIDAPGFLTNYDANGATFFRLVSIRRRQHLPRPTLTATVPATVETYGTIRTGPQSETLIRRGGARRVKGDARCPGGKSPFRCCFCAPSCFA
jgi:hypothetical protein